MDPLSSMFFQGDSNELLATVLSELEEDKSSAALRSLMERRRQLESLASFFDTSADVLEHPLMLPLGKHALIPATLVNTNEVTIKREDGTLERVSTKQAAQIARQRIAAIDEEILRIHNDQAKLEATEEKAIARASTRALADVARRFAEADNSAGAAAPVATRDPEQITKPKASPQKGTVEELRSAEDGNTYSYVTEFEEAPSPQSRKPVKSLFEAAAGAGAGAAKAGGSAASSKSSSGVGLTVKWRKSMGAPPKGLNVVFVDDDHDNDSIDGGGGAALKKRLDAAKGAKQDSPSLAALISAVDAAAGRISEEDEFASSSSADDTAASSPTAAATAAVSAGSTSNKATAGSAASKPAGGAGKSGFASGFLNKAAATPAPTAASKAADATAPASTSTSGSSTSAKPRVAFADPSQNQVKIIERVTTTTTTTTGDYDSTIQEPPAARINPRATPALIHPSSSSSSSSSPSTGPMAGRGVSSAGSSNAAFRGTIVERAPPSSVLLGGSMVAGGAAASRTTATGAAAGSAATTQGQTAQAAPQRKSLFKRQMHGEEAPSNEWL